MIAIFQHRVVPTQLATIAYVEASPLEQPHEAVQRHLAEYPEDSVAALLLVFSTDAGDMAA